MDEQGKRDKTRLMVRRRVRRRKMLRALLVLVAAGLLCGAAACIVVPVLRDLEPAQEETQSVVTTASAEIGSIEKTVFGTGAIQPASQPGVYAAVDASVSELLVEMGDSVKAGDVIVRLENDTLVSEIAELEYNLQTAQNEVRSEKTHEKYTYRVLYDEEGDIRYDPNTNEPYQGKYSNEISVRAPASGVIKAIYIEPGDDALAVYREKGAVMMLSTDGRMKVELEGVESGMLNIGDGVRIKGRGIDTTGTVVSLTRQGTQAVIQVTDNGYDMDTPVTVYTANGDVLGDVVGEGVLEINKPLAVSAYGGTIKGIAVSVGQTCERDDVLARLVWDEQPLYLDNAQVLREYAKAYVELMNAQEKLNDLTLVAPCDGKVASVDVSEGSDVTDGTLLLTLVEDGAGMTLTLAVDELDIVSVQPGQRVYLSVDALEDASLTGTVEKIAPIGTTSGSVTQFDVTIALDTADERILGGMNISGEIVVNSAENVLLIPTDALTKASGSYAVTLESGETRRVQVGIMTDDMAEITSGLSAGDTVVY